MNINFLKKEGDNNEIYARKSNKNGGIEKSVLIKENL